MRRALVRWLPQVPSSALAARRLSTAATAAAHFPFPQPQLAPRSRRTPPRRSSATAAAMSSPAAPAAAVAAANEVPTASVAASSSPAAASSSSASSSPPPLWSLAPNPCAHVTSALTRIVPLQFDQPRKPVRYEDGWEYFRRIGSPRHVCAPMVNQSELAFRLLVKKYNCHLSYTPMLHAEIFGKDPNYRAEAMQRPKDPQQDRPLVAQFCGNDPATLLKAARHVESWADAVDLNLGCPQGIAKRGHYGSFLLEEYQLLHDIVATLHQHLRIPVTCKIRRLPPAAGGDEMTVALVKMLQEAGAALITVHGRTRFQLKDNVGACDFDLIRLVKQNCAVPVLANGGIYTLEDVDRCLAHTGAEGVMSSESLLCNPSLFAGLRVDSVQMAQDYLDIALGLDPPTEQSMVRAHLFKMLYQQLSLHTDLRDRLAHCDPDDFPALVAEVARRFEGLSAEQLASQLSAVPVWYKRHEKTPAQLAAALAKTEAARLALEAARAAGELDEDEGLCDGFAMFEECCDEQQQDAAQQGQQQQQQM